MTRHALNIHVYRHTLPECTRLRLEWCALCHSAKRPLLTVFALLTLLGLLGAFTAHPWHQPTQPVHAVQYRI